MTNRTHTEHRGAAATVPGCPAGRTARPREAAEPARCEHGAPGEPQRREERAAAPGFLASSGFVLTLVGRAARRRLAQEAAGRGLKLWHVMVLCVLADSPGLSKAELADRLGLSSADVARVVGDLVSAGHVTCDRDEADRRRTLTRLTALGRETAAAVDAGLAAVEDEVLAPLAAADRERLADVLGRLAEHLDVAQFGLRPVRRRT
ncbi:MarR family transcriptional regulator [Kitasatospora purpeofusca]|uniref:MarR family winged helix-turn-helix transcriptional regulator n=1 Tax=Kitasatospora purpeofusca TaxID=67352 RepID=UPI0033CBDEBE